MEIIVAPNAFKNAVTAEIAADTIRRGIIRSFPLCNVSCFPIGDGGDGTASLIIDYYNGYRVPLEVRDPVGRKIRSSYGFIDDGKTAVIEMADASGIRLLGKEELDPLRTSSFGTGEMIADALARGAVKIILGMGGSATVDGGVGILEALGLQMADDWQSAIDRWPLREKLLNTEIVVLCDVENPLLGEYGAASVFGPQKGATAASIIQLEKRLEILSQRAYQHTGRQIAVTPRGGTAGGAAAGLYAFLNARLENGITYFLDLTDFDKRLLNCDLLITGEGSIDRQTLNGKGPFGVAKKAKQRGIPVIGLAGNVPAIPDSELQNYFDVLLAIGNGPADLQEAIVNTKENLERMGFEIGSFLRINSLLSVKTSIQK